MPAMILDGRKISAEIREELKGETARLKAKGIVPGLAGILVGEDPGSATYVGLKSKACEEIGIKEMMCTPAGERDRARAFQTLSINLTKTLRSMPSLSSCLCPSTSPRRKRWRPSCRKRMLTDFMP